MFDNNVTCDDRGDCVSFTNTRFSCYFDEGLGNVVCGVDLVKTTTITIKENAEENAITVQPPTFVVSELNSEGIFTVDFSEKMSMDV
jgi:hypothetical protein